MTVEKAIEILSDVGDINRCCAEDAEALDMAIKALEQEDVLDKIRAEIEQKQYYFMDDKDYDEGIRFGLMSAYQIVDKYKAEGEDVR